MLNQIFIYELVIVKFEQLTISINALLLVSALVISSITNYKYSKLFQVIIYIFILIGVTRLLQINQFDSKAIVFDHYRYQFFIHSLIFYKFNALVLYSFVYSIVLILLFSLFYPIFKSHKYFILTIIFIESFQLVFNILGLTNQKLSTYDIILYINGYIIGYLLYKIKTSRSD